MGEMADLIVNGDICQICSRELGDGNGYPETCTDCADEKPKKKRRKKK